jgi:hypothetical protein
MVAERWPFPGAIEIRKEINHYKCIGDSGHQYTVIEYQNFTHFKPLNGPAEDVAGTKGWLLLGGGYVNFVDDQTFQIVNTDELIRKIG